MRRPFAARREAKLRARANQWSYDRGYAQGRADMVDALPRCRRPAHLNYSSAPLATTCDECFTKATSPVPVPSVSKWDEHVSEALELLDAPPFPMVGDTWYHDSTRLVWNGSHWESQNTGGVGPWNDLR